MRLTKERLTLKITYIFLAVVFYIIPIIAVVIRKYDISVLVLLLLALLFTYLASRVGKKQNKVISKPYSAKKRL